MTLRDLNVVLDTAIDISKEGTFVAKHSAEYRLHQANPASRG